MNINSRVSIFFLYIILETFEGPLKFSGFNAISSALGDKEVSESFMLVPK
jgi:hypothetical protein